MNISAITSYGTATKAPSFGRKLKEDEKQGCKEAIQDGLKSLDKNMTIILPTNCSPSAKGKDVGIGQPHSDGSNKMLYPFLSNWGYTAQQRQPSGLGKQTDASPYVSNSSAYNSAIVDLESLTKPSKGALLSSETFNKIIDNNPKKDQNKSDYIYNVHAQKAALKEAYETFADKRANLDSLDEVEQKAIQKLDKDFEKFKKEHGEEQEKNALYNILTDIHGNDYWPNWDSEIDQTLFKRNNITPDGEKAREERLSELKSDYKEEIESFLFSQMLAKKTIEDGQKVMDKNGIKAIGDIPVAFSDAEVWGNRDLFLEHMRMGCKEPESWGNPPQKWGFFVLNPDLLFKPEGGLGKAGQFLYDKYERAFKENPGGVRIDHIVGLMDPYVYSTINPHHEGRLYSDLYRGTNGQNCDRILKDIILPAANSVGLNASNIIAEDLGYMPGNTKETLERLGIGGISVTQWMKPHEVQHASKNNAIMVSNHDTASAKELYPDKYERKNKFVELFSSGAKNVQIFWTDMFGIKERYNMPGVAGDENWSLRMTPDFEDSYHKSLEHNDALNIPEVVLEANRRKNHNFDHEHWQTAQALQHYANVLKEKE